MIGARVRWSTKVVALPSWSMPRASGRSSRPPRPVTLKHRQNRLPDRARVFLRCGPHTGARAGLEAMEGLTDPIRPS